MIGSVAFFVAVALCIKTMLTIVLFLVHLRGDTLSQYGCSFGGELRS